MAKHSCAMCRQDREGCKVFQLTAAEKEGFEARDIEPPEELAYCQPCWRIISDPISGPAFMKGLFQIQLQSLGVINAENIASKYHTELLKGASKPRS